MHTETQLKEQYRRLLLILQTRNQIIKAQQNIIERQEESHRMMMQLIDPPPATMNDMEDAVVRSGMGHELARARTYDPDSGNFT